MSGIQKKQQNKRTQAKAPAKNDAQKTMQPLNLEQLIAAPETMRSEEILAAQQQVGNQVVQRALDGKKKRDAMTDEQGYLKGEINDAIQKKRGGGSPLPESLREDAGKRLGHDFDDVRIHTDEQANELSQSINARAFTIGKDIFFKKGVFSPGSRAGRETLMHELTHVVQQSGSNGANGRLKLGGPDTAHEKQADKVGKANSGADSVKSASNSKGTVQRLQGRLNALRGKKITKTEEEEKLQKQPDPAVQREEMPEEEELMMQEEEELQMQPDTGVVQRMDEKARKHAQLMEEVKGFNPRELKGPRQEQAPDDDAAAPARGRAQDTGDPLAARVGQRGPAPDDDAQVQLQRDNVVQREGDDDWETDPDYENTQERAPQISRAKMSEMGGMLIEGMKKGETKTQKDRAMEGIKSFDRSKLKSTETKDRSAPNLAIAKEEMKDNRDKALLEGRGLRKVSESEKKYSDAPNLEMSGKEKEQLTKNVSKGKLMDVLRDPSKSPEEIQEAQEQLKDMHGGKNKEFKKAKAERREKLKNSAQKGDKEAYQKWKAEKGTTKGEKFASGAKKVGGFLGGLGKRFVGKAVSDISDQLFGAPEKKEEAKEAAPASTGGGGAGLAGVLEEKIAENQRLKALLKENGIQAEKGA